jgi:hypothetical protein
MRSPWSEALLNTVPWDVVRWMLPVERPRGGDSASARRGSVTTPNAPPRGLKWRREEPRELHPEYRDDLNTFLRRQLVELSAGVSDTSHAEQVFRSCVRISFDELCVFDAKTWPIRVELSAPAKQVFGGEGSPLGSLVEWTALVAARLPEDVPVNIAWTDGDEPILYVDLKYPANGLHGYGYERLQAVFAEEGLGAAERMPGKNRTPPPCVPKGRSEIAQQSVTYVPYKPQVEPEVPQQLTKHVVRWDLSYYACFNRAAGNFYKWAEGEMFQDRVFSMLV